MLTNIEGRLTYKQGNPNDRINLILKEAENFGFSIWKRQNTLFKAFGNNIIRFEKREEAKISKFIKGCNTYDRISVFTDASTTNIKRSGISIVLTKNEKLDKEDDRFGKRTKIYTDSEDSVNSIMNYGTLTSRKRVNCNGRAFLYGINQKKKIDLKLFFKLERKV